MAHLWKRWPKSLRFSRVAHKTHTSKIHPSGPEVRHQHAKTLTQSLRFPRLSLPDGSLLVVEGRATRRRRPAGPAGPASLGGSGGRGDRGGSFWYQRGGGGAAAAAAAGCGRDGVRIRVRGGVWRRSDARGLLPRLRRARAVPLGAGSGRRRGRTAVPHRVLSSERR